MITKKIKNFFLNKARADLFIKPFIKEQTQLITLQTYDVEKAFKMIRGKLKYEKVNRSSSLIYLSETIYGDDTDVWLYKFRYFIKN